MVGGDAELFNGFAMFFGGVALVGEPIVLGIFLCQAVHIVITIGLGEDRGSCDSEVFTEGVPRGRGLAAPESVCPLSISSR